MEPLLRPTVSTGAFMSGAAASAPDPRLEMGVNVFHYKNTLAYYKNWQSKQQKVCLFGQSKLKWSFL